MICNSKNKVLIALCFLMVLSSFVIARDIDSISVKKAQEASPVKLFINKRILIPDSMKIWTPSSVKRQSKNSARDYYDESTKYLSAKNYDKAIEAINEAISRDTTYSDAMLRMGDLYRILLQDTKKGLKYYYNHSQFFPDSSIRVYLHMAEAELRFGNYRQAQKSAERYLTYQNITEEKRNIAEMVLACCKFAMKAIKESKRISLVNLGKGVNSIDDEYLPALTVDELTVIFTRRKDGGDEDFMISTRDTKDNVWHPAVPLSENINTPDNEGAHCISPDGTLLLFTGCNRQDGQGRCDIYFSRKVNGDWTKPQNMGESINSSSWDAQPSISSDGNSLYFVSDRKGGFGGNDIWVSTIQSDGSWGSPKNLGPSINTERNEITPFIHPDDETLYFSSDGWVGMGDKDIYMSKKLPNGQWSTCVNLGFPINTSGEESGMTVGADGRMAYYASNRLKGEGKMDLYSFKTHSKMQPYPIVYVKGKIRDAATNQPLSAKVEISEINTGDLVGETETDDSDGTALFALKPNAVYTINVFKEGYLFYSDNFTPVDSTRRVRPYEFTANLQRIAIGSKVNLKNVYFEKDKYELLQVSEPELNRVVEFLNQNPEVLVELSGHTDNTGDAMSNKTLSELRAKEVYDYLVFQGISAKRMRYVGFGDTRPITSNDTEDGRRQNRRTEMLIVPAKGKARPSNAPPGKKSIISK